jgi:hypothetical protein
MSSPDPAVLMTEVMSAQELASWFNLSRYTVGKFLQQLDGAQRHGKFWRVPLVEMPPSYLLSRGLLVAVGVDSSGSLGLLADTPTQQLPHSATGQ